jgi:small Trp-rich protein
MIMKYLEAGPVAGWDWWWVMSPFGMAVAWWAWADWSGYTKKQAMARENARRQRRIDSNRHNIGSLANKKKR